MSDILEQFALKPIVPIHLGSFDISFTQSSAFMIAGALLTIALMTLTVRGKALIPGRWQNISEILYESIFGLTREYLSDEAWKYFPFVFTVFMVVLMGNLFGLIPFAYTYTSQIIVTGALAVLVVGSATLIGFVRHGLHFFTLFFPSGTPLLMAPFIIPVEIISYLSRPVSLSIRLCLNMVMGHMLMRLIGGFCVTMIALGIGLKLFTAVTFSVNTMLMALECLVALIQAHVFAVLTCVYLKDGVELH